MTNANHLRANSKLYDSVILVDNNRGPERFSLVVSLASCTSATKLEQILHYYEELAGT